MDNECKNLKYLKFNYLRKYRCPQEISDLNKYKQLRNKFKDLSARKQRAFYARQLESLLEVANSPLSFWKKMKTIARSSTSNVNTITTEEWKTHFEQLFRYENFNDDGDEENSSDNEFEVDLDEIQFIVFNSPITEEGILKSVKALHESEAAGLDDLPSGSLIHAIDI